MTADERINALIERAGSPVMVVRNTQEDELERRRGIYSETRKTIEEQFEDSMILYIRHLADTIDRLEAALHNVINERDQLLADFGELVFYMNVKGDACEYCKHYGEHGCQIYGCYFEWRGVQDKEDAK